MKLSNVFVRTNSRTYCLSGVASASDVKLRIEQLEGIASEFQSLYYNARRLDGPLDGVGSNSTLTVHLSLKGGKGGFGAKLKNEGSKKVRSNNNIHSRDLSGRRIRNVNLEKEYIQSYKKKLQEDKIVKEEREKFKLRENTLYEEHAFMRLDKNYTAELENGQKNIQEAVKKGLMSNWRKIYGAKKAKVNEDEVQEDKEASSHTNKQEQAKRAQQGGDTPSLEANVHKECLKRPREEQGDHAEQESQQPRKIAKLTPPSSHTIDPSDKKIAEKTISDLLAKPVETGASNMHSAAEKLKSLFRK